MADAVAEHNYVFNVSMSCGGCSGAVERVLKKLEGNVSRDPFSNFPLPHSPTTRHPTTLLSSLGHIFPPQKISKRPPVPSPAQSTSHHIPSHQAGRQAKLTHKPTGVKSYEVSLDTQTAKVVADDSLPYEKVLKTIAKTGKKVNSGEADGVAQSVEVPAE